MVTSPSTTHRSAVVSRHQHRQRQRGAAVFIVLLVLAVLTAVGLFAVRSASLVDRASGHARQSMQTMTMGELGARTMVSHATILGAENLVRSMGNREQCFTTTLSPVNAQGNRPKCTKVSSTEMANAITLNYPGSTLITPQTVDEPGSLGPQLAWEGDSTARIPAREGAFVAEMTDEYAIYGGNGFDLNKRTHTQVTLTVFSQVRSAPPTGPDAAWCADWRVARSASLQKARLHVIFPTVQ